MRALLAGLQAPLIQAPMAGVQGADLAVAVSQAGGLGSLPCAMLDLPAMEAALATLQARGLPFNANFFCHAPIPADPQREAAWRQRLAPYYAELGIDAAALPVAPARQPFNAAMAALVCRYRPAVVSFHFGLPAPELLEQVRGCGAVILSSATTVEEGLWLQAQGVDAVIAQGLEAGGHRGMFLSDDIATQVGSLALLPQLVAALDVPVIAAGGIADARGVQAALSLGACAAQVGTAYLLCPEATTSAVHRTALQSPAAQVTALTNLFTGRPARSILNRLMRELGPMHPQAPAFPHAAGPALPLRQRAEAAGSGDFSPLWAGQNTSGCRAVPAAALTRALAGLP